MSKLNKKWGNKKNSFKLSVFKKRILKTGAEDIIEKYNDINDSNKKDGDNQYDDDNNNDSDESGNNNCDDDGNNDDLSKLEYFKIEKREKKVFNDIHEYDHD